MYPILALSGKMGSGKDTVARIIQELTYLNVQGFPCADHIVARLVTLPGRERFLNQQAGFNYALWQNKRWGDKLKQVAAALLGEDDFLTKWESRDPGYRDQVLPAMWDYCDLYDQPVSVEHARLICRSEGLVFQETDVHQMTRRMFVQLLGTNAMRFGLHEDVWVNATMQSYQPRTVHRPALNPMDAAVTDVQYPRWILSDNRFENEMLRCEQHGALTIRIERPSLPKQADEHISERELDHYPFMETLRNEGTLPELVGQVRSLLLRNRLLTPYTSLPDARLHRALVNTKRELLFA